MTDKPTILLTGFEAFGGEHINPSREIVLSLDGEFIGAHRVIGAILPVAFAPTLPLMEALLEEHAPRIVVALGQAGGRGELSLERVAINLVDARIPDNDGDQPIDEAVVTDAPGAYFSSLPLKAVQSHLRSIGIPSALSFTAGSFVCNQVFFALAHLCATRWPATRAGFVHVPWLPEQAARHPGQPSMALETMIAGVRAVLECTIATAADLRIAGGTTC